MSQDDRTARSSGNDARGKWGTKKTSSIFASNFDRTAIRRTYADDAGCRRGFLGQPLVASPVVLLPTKSAHSLQSHRPN